MTGAFPGNPVAVNLDQFTRKSHSPLTVAGSAADSNCVPDTGAIADPVGPTIGRYRDGSMAAIDDDALKRELATRADMIDTTVKSTP
jgi:hypothetical protein